MARTGTFKSSDSGKNLAWLKAWRKNGKEKGARN